MSKRSTSELIVMACIGIVAAILIFLSVKSCKEKPKPQPPTVEKVLLDTLRAAFNRMEQYNTQLQQKVDSLTKQVTVLTAKQQQAKQGASNAIAQYNTAKQKKDTAAAITACDSLKQEHLAYVQYTEQKDVEVAAIINTKDDQLHNFKNETDNLKLQTTILETSNKNKDETIAAQDKKLTKTERKAKRNGTFAKIFGGTTAIAIIIAIISLITPI